MATDTHFTTAEFLTDVLSRGTPGYLCAAYADRQRPRPDGKPDFHEVFFSMPAQLDDALAWFTKQSGDPQRDAYFCAHLLRTQTRKKSVAMPLGACFADIDHDTIPDGVPQPTYIVESSAGRYQAYWKLADTLTPEDAERLNKRLAMACGADPSGYDLTQLLRVPGTINYKPGRGQFVVRTVRSGTESYTAAELDAALPPLPEEPQATRHEADEDEPPVRLTASESAWWHGHTTKTRVEKGKLIADRSATLFVIGQILARHGMTLSGIVAALADRDAKLGFNRYTDRPDEYERIADKALADSGQDPFFVNSYSSSKAKIENLPPVPDFPLDTLPEPIRAYVAEHAESIGVPPGMVATPLLAFAGGTIGNTVRLKLKSDFIVTPNLWSVVVAHPGTAKTPAQNAARYPVGQMQSDAHRAWSEQVASWEVAAAAAKKAKQPIPARPELDHYKTSDATIEAVGKMLSTSPGVTMDRDEVVSFVNSFDQYRQGKGGDRQNWLSLWAGVPIKIDRKSTDPIVIGSPVVAIAGGIQPDLLGKLAAEAGQQDGFVERFLFDYPNVKPSGWTDDEPSGSTNDAALSVFRRLRHCGTPYAPPDGVTVTKLSDEARPLWRDWYDDNQQRIAQGEGLARGFDAKMPIHAARLALVLHCLTNPQQPGLPVSAQTLAHAFSLADYYRANARRVLAHFGAVKVDKAAAFAERVLAVLRSKAGAWVSRTELSAAFSRNVSANDLTAALHSLKDAGSVECETTTTGGRPSERWRLVIAEKDSSEEYEKTKKGHAGETKADAGDLPDDYVIDLSNVRRRRAAS